MLGVHQDIQENVRKEIDEIAESGYEEEIEQDEEVIKTNMFTLDDLKKMKYLDCVMKEVQRIYPTAPFIARELPEDTFLSIDKQLKSLSSRLILLYSIFLF